MVGDRIEWVIELFVSILSLFFSLVFITFYLFLTKNKVFVVLAKEIDLK